MFGFFKKIRFSLRLGFAFWQTHRKTIVLTFLLGIIIASFLPRALVFFRQRQPTKIGFSGKYTPETLPDEILSLLSQGLSKVNEKGLPEPAAASSWKTKNQGKTYRFALKEGLFWHDKEAVTAKDIRYNFSDVSVNKIDSYTIEFELKESFSPFPSAVSRPLFKKGLIGMGDFRVRSIEKNGQIVERLVLESRQKEKQRLIYKFYPSEALLKTAFKLGKIDIAHELTTPNELLEWPGIKVEEKVKKDRLVAIIFNTESPFLGSKPLRQALAYSLKKDWPNRTFGPINPNSWAYNPNLKRYQFDLEKARELLKKGLGEQDGEEAEIRLTTFPILFSLAEEIARDWKGLGLKVEIETTNVIPEEFQALLVIEDIPPDPDQYLLWHSTQASNISRFKSAQIDKLLEDGRKILNQEERKEIYFDFQRFLVEDAPIIFLYHPTVYTISRE
jgi:peptide/nickel transport system substrate-binding protein